MTADNCGKVEGVTGGHSGRVVQNLSGTVVAFVFHERCMRADFACREDCFTKALWKYAGVTGAHSGKVAGVTGDPCGLVGSNVAHAPCEHLRA